MIFLHKRPNNSKKVNEISLIRKILLLEEKHMVNDAKMQCQPIPMELSKDLQHRLCRNHQNQSQRLHKYSCSLLWCDYHLNLHMDLPQRLALAIYQNWVLYRYQLHPIRSPIFKANIFKVNLKLKLTCVAVPSNTKFDTRNAGWIFCVNVITVELRTHAMLITKKYSFSYLLRHNELTHFVWCLN